MGYFVIKINIHVKCFEQYLVHRNTLLLIAVTLFFLDIQYEKSVQLVSHPTELLWDNIKPDYCCISLDSVSHMGNTDFGGL